MKMSQLKICELKGASGATYRDVLLTLTIIEKRYSITLYLYLSVNI